MLVTRVPRRIITAAAGTVVEELPGGEDKVPGDLWGVGLDSSD